VERYKQAFQRAGGTPLIDYYRALVDGMALGTQDERWVLLGNFRIPQQQVQLVEIYKIPSNGTAGGAISVQAASGQVY